ncbi:MAG: hypothetical protein ACOCXQ_01850 [Patescibacteria group bacterium]
MEKSFAMPERLQTIQDEVFHPLTVDNLRQISDEVSRVANEAYYAQPDDSEDPSSHDNVVWIKDIRRNLLHQISQISDEDVRKQYLDMLWYSNPDSTPISAFHVALNRDLADMIIDDYDELSFSSIHEDWNSELASRLAKEDPEQFVQRFEMTRLSHDNRKAIASHLLLNPTTARLSGAYIDRFSLTPEVSKQLLSEYAETFPTYFIEHYPSLREKVNEEVQNDMEKLLIHAAEEEPFIFHNLHKGITHTNLDWLIKRSESQITTFITKRLNEIQRDAGILTEDEWRKRFVSVKPEELEEFKRKGYLRPVNSLNRADKMYYLDYFIATYGQVRLQGSSQNGQQRKEDLQITGVCGLEDPTFNQRLLVHLIAQQPELAYRVPSSIWKDAGVLTQYIEQYTRAGYEVDPDLIQKIPSQSEKYRLAKMYIMLSSDRAISSFSTLQAFLPDDLYLRRKTLKLLIKHETMMVLSHYDVLKEEIDVDMTSYIKNQLYKQPQAYLSMISTQGARFSLINQEEHEILLAAAARQDPPNYVSEYLMNPSDLLRIPDSVVKAILPDITKDTWLLLSLLPEPGIENNQDPDNQQPDIHTNRKNDLDQFCDLTGLTQDEIINRCKEGVERNMDRFSFADLFKLPLSREEMLSLYEQLFSTDNAVRGFPIETMFQKIGLTPREEQEYMLHLLHQDWRTVLSLQDEYLNAFITEDDDALSFLMSQEPFVIIENIEDFKRLLSSINQHNHSKLQVLVSCKREQIQVMYQIASEIHKSDIGEDREDVSFKKRTLREHLDLILSFDKRILSKVTPEVFKALLLLEHETFSRAFNTDIPEEMRSQLRTFNPFKAECSWIIPHVTKHAINQLVDRISEYDLFIPDQTMLSIDSFNDEMYINRLYVISSERTRDEVRTLYNKVITRNTNQSSRFRDDFMRYLFTCADPVRELELIAADTNPRQELIKSLRHFSSHLFDQFLENYGKDGNAQLSFQAKQFMTDASTLTTAMMKDLSVEEKRRLFPDGMTGISDEKVSRMMEFPFHKLTLDAKKSVLLAHLHEVIENTQDDEHKKEADQRNRRIQNTDQMVEGTLLHATNQRAISTILRNGNLAGECVGVYSRPDSFPFHTDFIQVQTNQPTADTPSFKDHYSNNFASLTSGSANSAGEAVVLMYSREPSFNPTPYGELLKATNHFENHYLIFAGIPSTEITGMILDRPDSNSLSAIQDSIVINGFYIPVYNSNGELLFTSEAYDAKQRELQTFEANSLSPLFEDPSTTSEQIMEAAMKHPYIRRQYHMPVNDGSLQDHVQYVLRQYQRYFAKLSSEQRQIMGYYALLHDIRKPDAIAEGVASRHHEYSAEEIRNLLPRLGGTPEQVNVTAAITRDDAFGDYLQERAQSVTSPYKYVARIRQQASEAGVDPVTFLETYIIPCYIMDASSYTREAGNMHGLDDIFIFDRKAGTADFSQRYAGYVQELRNAMYEGEE